VVRICGKCQSRAGLLMAHRCPLCVRFVACARVLWSKAGVGVAGYGTMIAIGLFGKAIPCAHAPGNVAAPKAVARVTAIKVRPAGRVVIGVSRAIAAAMIGTDAAASVIA
jgi:hypothetical protein